MTPDRPSISGPPVRVGQRVRDFYNELPFNYYSDSRTAAASVRRCRLAAIYPDLGRILEGRLRRSAIEFGCGGGWLANSLALSHHFDVVGVDFCGKAIERSRKVARELGLENLHFVCEDLTAYRGSSADLVLSIGVLHHTEDARTSFAAIEKFVKPGGHIYFGLYHDHGRRPFLEHFKRLHDEEGEAAALARFARLEGHQDADVTHLRSWFRDQVLHPHESTHTLLEVMAWLDEAGLRLESTSLNRFAAIDDLSGILASEPGLEAVGRRALEVENRFYPGFFTICASRP